MGCSHSVISDEHVSTL